MTAHSRPALGKCNRHARVISLKFPVHFEAIWNYISLQPLLVLAAAFCCWRLSGYELMRETNSITLKLKALFAGLLLLGTAAAAQAGETVLVEAESFENPGGWALDTQFIEIMGSPYLLAHGMGQPVKDAVTTVKFPSSGKYRVLVRTKDWVARWKAPGAPGKFQVLVNGEALKETFGTKSEDWFWQDGGAVEIKGTEAKVALHDLTGFEGRCDAIIFTKDPTFIPPNTGEILPQWRRELMGLPAKPVEAGPYDLVVVGGGYGGMGAAIAAARMGIKVALIQNRPVLGGNGSSEIRVWAQGGTRRGLYPKLGGIVEEFMDKAKSSPGTFEEFGDAKKEELVRAEKNITLFLNNHVFSVETNGNHLVAVLGLDTRTGKVTRFAGKLFVDSTGHATVGALAGADHTVQEEGHLGMSNMWRWENGEAPTKFPETPWGLEMTMDDFPYPKKGHAEWFWESGFDKHPLRDLEYTRDWNFRAIYGAFNTMKNKDGAKEHPNAKMTWVAYVGGTRESRQLLGDVILTRDDITNKKAFPDGCVPTTWDIDLHYPREQYMSKFPKDPFISKAVFDKAVDRNHGYPVPYRSFYSRNIDNLFMAGRNVSVTHEALGTVRVMKTGGMMGEVVGKAASICIKQSCLPRDVYHSYFEQLKELMNLDHYMRRDTLAGQFYKPEGSAELPPPQVFGTGVDIKKIPGIVIDDEKAVKKGKWTTGEGLKGYIGKHYIYSREPGASVRFEFEVPATGKYEVRVSAGTHENRASNTPVTVTSSTGAQTVRINQKVETTLPDGFTTVGTFTFEAGKKGAVEIGTEQANGNVHVDAVQLLPAK
jgi:hypothetical protein